MFTPSPPFTPAAGFSDGDKFWVALCEVLCGCLWCSCALLTLEQHKLAPAWAGIFSAMLPLRGDIIAQLRPQLDVQKALCNDVLVKDGVVYDRMQPLATTLSLFEGMDERDISHLLELRQQVQRALAAQWPDLMGCRR